MPEKWYQKVVLVAPKNAGNSSSSITSSSLPPKKRKLFKAVEAAAPVKTEEEEPRPPTRLVSCESLSSSAEEQTVLPCATLGNDYSAIMPSIAIEATFAARNSMAMLSQWASTDPKLVAETFRANEETEKLKIAKSMLYDALHGQC